jgi:hypothetical protein
MQTVPSARRVPGWAAVLLATLLPACGNDDVTAVNPGPPALVIADLPEHFDLGSDDQRAKDASAFANELLSSIWPEGGHAHADLNPMRDLPWTPADGGCVSCVQDWRPLYLKRLLTIVCPEGDGFGWEIHRQTLDKDGSVVDSHVGLRGTTAADGSTGEFSYLRVEAPHPPLVSWSWHASPDRSSVDWQFFLGPAQPSALDADLHWSRDSAGERRWTWIWPEDERIEFDLNEDDTAGWIHDDRWAAEADGWSRRSEVRWQDGHGEWTTYDAEGSLVLDEEW